MSRLWTKNEIDILIDCYKKKISISEMMVLLPGRTYASIRNKASSINVPNRPISYSTDLIEYVKNNYKGWNLSKLSEETGIHKTNLARLARKLGVIPQKKSYSENSNYAWIDGKYRKKTYQGLTKEQVVKKMQQASWSRTKEQYQAAAKKMVITRDRNMKFNKSNPYSRTVSGKREDLDNKFFRSKWEANYARYLNHLGIKWEYEPKRFWFDSIKTGTRSYQPDFYLVDQDKWVEVKGWMDAQSKTKLKRFAKYYPDEYAKLVLIDQHEYKIIEKEFSDIIPMWEKR